jgi:hypothetical protein
MSVGKHTSRFICDSVFAVWFDVFLLCIEILYYSGDHSIDISCVILTTFSSVSLFIHHLFNDN